MSPLDASSGLGAAETPSTEPPSGLLPNRLSVTNLEDLKKRILRVIAHCNKPKVSGGLGAHLRGAEAGRATGRCFQLPSLFDQGLGCCCLEHFALRADLGLASHRRCRRRHALGRSRDATVRSLQ